MGVTDEMIAEMMKEYNISQHKQWIDIIFEDVCNRLFPALRVMAISAKKGREYLESLKGNDTSAQLQSLLKKKKQLKTVSKKQEFLNYLEVEQKRL